MSSSRKLFLIAALGLASSFASATTVVVGGCRPKYPSYPTISQALSSVPAGSIVLVCPGTYPEQITISQAVTLEGVIQGNAGRAVITVPAGLPGGGSGLQVNVTSQFTGVFLGGLFPFAAQVLVQSPGPVLISNVTVDGTGGDMNCSTTNIWLAGIFFNSASSLTLSRVTTRNQLDEGCGNGIWMEDTTGPNQAVTVVNSSVHDFDYAGILAGTAGTDAWLAATIKGNFVFRGTGGSSYFGAAGIASDFVNGSVAANLVTGGDTGIFNLSSAPLTVISGNWVADAHTGISTGFDGGTIQHNQVANTSTAMDLESNDATAQYNLIKNSNIAIEFACDNDTVKGNNINDSAIGLDNIPSGFVSSDHFFNVDTLATNCSLSPAQRRTRMPAMRLSSSQKGK